MLKTEAAKIIERNARNNVLRFQDLDYDERRTLVTYLMLQDEMPLIDADNDKSLQRAVAWVIASNGSDVSIEALKYTIFKIFINGCDAPYLEPHYAEKINDLLSRSWDELHTKPNEHFEHDVMQRTRDVQMSNSI